MTVTILAAGIMALWHFVLTVNVITHRVKTKTVNGADSDNPDSALHRSIRAHGNNAEYTPLLLILLGCLDYGGASNLLLLPLAAALVLARLLHGYGMGFTDGSVRFYRMAGTLLTLTSLMVGGISALLLAFKVI